MNVEMPVSTAFVCGVAIATTVGTAIAAGLAALLGGAST